MCHQTPSKLLSGSTRLLKRSFSAAMTPTGWRFGPRGTYRPLFGRLRSVRPLRRLPDVPAFHEAFTGCPTVAPAIFGRYIDGLTHLHQRRPSSITLRSPSQCSAVTSSAGPFTVPRGLHRPPRTRHRPFTVPDGLHRPLFDHFRGGRPPERRRDHSPFPEASINRSTISTTVFGHLDVGRTALSTGPLSGLR